MKIFKLTSAAWLIASLLMGCVGTNPSAVTPQEFMQPTAMTSTKYTKLEPGDTLEVSVEVDGNMEVSMHRAKVSAAGMVTLPLVGDVHVGQLYLSAARARIAAQYSAYYVNTPVTMVTRVDGAEPDAWGYVTVLGRVQRPGRVTLKSAEGMKLSQAIQESGGFSPSAKKTEVRVSRVDDGGRKKQVSIDFQQIGQQGNVEADITLMNGDVVYVPERIF